MIEDALRYLDGQSLAAVAPKLIDVGDPRKLVYAHGEHIAEYPTPPRPRAHAAGTLAEIVSLANRFKGAGSKPVVWYSADKVVLVIDDDGHRLETATLSLEVSDVFARLVELRQNKPWMDQKPFIRLLRIDLAGTGDDTTMLIERCRRLKWESGSAATGVVERNRESLGRDITGRVEANGELPEQILVTGSVWKTSGMTGKLGMFCSVDTDPAVGKLQLLPLPDEVERVRSQAVANLGANLAQLLDDGICFYEGRP